MHCNWLVCFPYYVANFAYGLINWKVNRLMIIILHNNMKLDCFSYQGLRIVFEDGSRIVMRLSGTGSSGATVRYKWKKTHDFGNTHEIYFDLFFFFFWSMNFIADCTSIHMKETTYSAWPAKCLNHLFKLR